jgi:hypothetical protein
VICVYGPEERQEATDEFYRNLKQIFGKICKTDCKKAEDNRDEIHTTRGILTS